MTSTCGCGSGELPARGAAIAGGGRAAATVPSQIEASQIEASQIEASQPTVRRNGR